MSRWQGPCHQVLDQRLWVLWRLRAWPQASRAFDRNGCRASGCSTVQSVLWDLWDLPPHICETFEKNMLQVRSMLTILILFERTWRRKARKGKSGPNECQASRESEKKIVWTIRCRIKPCARKIYITTIEQISNKCTMNSAEVSRVWGKGLQHRHTVISFTSFARSGDWRCLQAVPVALRCKSRGGF